MSDQTSPSGDLNAPQFMSRGLVIYFGVLFVLAFIAFIPDAVLIGLFLFILPGLILIASGTLLYYSIALLPAYFINRHLGKRLVAAVVAVFSVAAAALLPHYIQGYQLRRLVARDHSDPPTSFRPQSFELPYPEGAFSWTDWRGTGDWPPPPCADLCQQLLFKANLDQVVIREHSDPLSNATFDWKKSKLYHQKRNGLTEIPLVTPSTESHPFRLKVWRFRLQRREACLETLSIIKGEFVHEVAGGRCLIEDAIDTADANVVLSISESPIAYRTYQDRLQTDRCQPAAISRIEKGPTTVTISERRGEQMIAVETKTTLVAQYATMPFYFSPIQRGHSPGLNGMCLVVARDPFPSSFADPFEMIARRYRLPIAAPESDRLSILFSVPVSDEDRTVVNAILNHDYGAGGLVPKTSSRLVASFVNSRLKTGQLNQDDVELIRALLKQRAFTSSIETDLRPETYQALKPLLPEMFERIAYRTDGQSQIVQSLNEMLDNFSAEDTDPYSLTLCREGKNGDLRVCYKREFRNSRKN